MTLNQILLALLGMIVATLLCRLLPLLLPDSWLRMPWLESLNRALPLSIMLILILSSIQIERNGIVSVSAIAYQLIAMSAVFLFYRKTTNTLLSVVVGVGSLNLLYWLF